MLTDEGNEGNDSCEKHETCAKKPRSWTYIVVELWSHIYSEFVCKPLLFHFWVFFFATNFLGSKFGRLLACERKRNNCARRPGWLSSRAVLREEKEEQVLWLSACYHVFMLISYNVAVQTCNSEITSPTRFLGINLHELRRLHQRMNQILFRFDRRYLSPSNDTPRRFATGELPDPCELNRHHRLVRLDLGDNQPEGLSVECWILDETFSTQNFNIELEVTYTSY